MAATENETSSTRKLVDQEEEEDIHKQTNANTKEEQCDGLLKPPVSKRERRNVSSPCLNITESLCPMSPSSTASSNTNDSTWNPTLEMMVNDFDDEQTLNEEEAIAAAESQAQNPDEEINTLKEESEIPLEELLAKYQALPPIAYIEPPLRKKAKKSNKKKHKSKQKPEILAASSSANDQSTTGELAKELCDTERVLPDDEDKVEEEDDNESLNEDQPKTSLVMALDEKSNDAEQVDEQRQNKTGNVEMHKVRRTHLLELYPEGTFNNVSATEAVLVEGEESLYGAEDEEDDDIEEDEEYKKKVMIGPSYQASIPHGQSQYGDILPYENEDKLIWEPSQVSEKEVEEYLLRIRDIKSNQASEEETTDSTGDAGGTKKEHVHKSRNSNNMENSSLLANGEKSNNVPGGISHAGVSSDLDVQAVVKDNEQALHLLVQCGYDFKEALRRKRLNALPLNDCMSLWSEEECQKFEEGIQKFGKDFVKIRQNQVRTRTMRELVQFYYLWKKSERRDHNFANADTVDHMDIYLNEDNDYGSNTASVNTPVGSPAGNSTTTATTRRNISNIQKNISIMTNNVISSDKNCASTQQKSRPCTNTNDSSNSDNSLSTTTLNSAK